MGLSLHAISWEDWMETVPREARGQFREAFRAHVGQDPSNDWVVQKEDSRRIGSYFAFNVFRMYCEYAITGHVSASDDDFDGLEQEAFIKFRSETPPQRHISGSDHFLEVGDTDTLFIPVEFDHPLEWYDRWIASKPMALESLEELAQACQFDLTAQMEKEWSDEGDWVAPGTARNVARILYAFFSSIERGCIEFA